MPLFPLPPMITAFEILIISHLIQYLATLYYIYSACLYMHMPVASDYFMWNCL
ncbi:hypothetical protein XCR1_1920032 [Xenorhabdus cabanillasii JM26]|uniref:Uncharacterized protein n=1 Tax=Xenorhabdus cabanillasii JM26 TaxID=1427517 RepID=W1J309_9GAMM|nr:hypothetical protein XCR1_1920032 [Xenorhabdus cabanillasii JM26]